MPGPKRSVRVAGQLKVALAELLGRVSDPRLVGIVVTRVELTDDLALLTARIRMLEGGDDEKKRKDALRALERASGMLKRELAVRVKTRIVPNLRFFYDEGQDHTTRVEALLREISSEKK